MTYMMTYMITLRTWSRNSCCSASRAVDEKYIKSNPRFLGLTNNAYTTPVVGQTISVVGYTTSVVGQTISVVGYTTSVVGLTTSIVGQAIPVVGQTISVVGYTASVVG